jgi:hypothetical protein
MSTLYYIANVRMPTEKAHGIQIAKMCEAFAGHGLQVELVVPARSSVVTEDPFSYYKVRKNFSITKLWCIDALRFGWPGFWIESITFAQSVAWHVLRKQGTFYTREEFLAFCLTLLGKQVVWEAHMGQQNWFVRFLVRRRVPIVVISGGLLNLYREMGVAKELLLVAHDAVDVAQFDLPISKIEARETLGLSAEAKIVLYTGSRYAWKGVETLEQARALLPGMQVLIVSGKPYAEIPLYLRAADVLVIPNSAKEDISRLYTSPMKLFEYMASGTPVASSDLPSIREVLDDSTACFFAPDNAEGLAQAVGRILSDPAAAQQRSKRARLKVEEYSWHERARTIMLFIQL